MVRVSVMAQNTLKKKVMGYPGLQPLFIEKVLVLFSEST